jgi:hypothetical protein
MNRRTFLQKSVLAGTATAFTAKAESLLRAAHRDDPAWPVRATAAKKQP